MKGAYWTPDHDAQLRELWETGISCSEIGLQIGGRSRNSVIGRAHRLGLEPHDKYLKARNHKRATAKRVERVRAYKPLPAPRAPPVAKTPHNPLGGKLANLTAPAPPRPIRALAWSPLPGCLPVSIMDRKESQCSWPIDLAGAAFPHFCGAKRKGRGSYCAAHNTLAANPSAAKPDRTEAQLLADAKRRASHLKRIADLRDARWAS